jgi:hypothetical protein
MGREARSPLGKKTGGGLVKAAFDFHAGHNPRSFSPKEKARMRGKGVSNGQAAICFLRTHGLGFSH